MPHPVLLFIALFLPWLSSSYAADRYVSTTGSNAGAGTLASPYRTIDFAADRANAGDTIFVRGGEYRERLTPSRSGTSSNRITIKNYADEVPIIDGTGQGVGGQTAMVDIGNRSYLTLDGFQIRNLITSTNTSTPIGILIDGASIGIRILNCEIYNIRNNGNNGNAHGLIARGTSSTPISELIIQGNELRDLVLGNSEAMVLNGNVDGFEVRENFVHDCNNLGIDFIGFESTGPAGQDQARNGVCADNTVTNISTLTNPAYNAYTAGGIYVDGGRDIIIERNRVSNCDIGIEVASEDPAGSTSNITVRDNLIWNNNIGGIFVGGYNATRGAALNCSITGNTLYENDTTRQYSGEILVQFNTSNLSIRNNLFVAGPEKVFVLVNNGNNSGITLDYNLYYSRFATTQNTSEWIWNGTFRFGFNNWKSFSGQDSNSVYGNPQLSTPDFTIASNSAAREAGDLNFTPADTQTDVFGNPRVSGNRVDAGAHEFVFTSELQQWRQLYFGISTDTGDAANLADPDCDGLPNLVEFSLANQNPTVPSNESPLRIISGELQFTRNPDASAEVTYVILGSQDLDFWQPLATRPASGNWSFVSNVTISESVSNTIFIDNRSGLGTSQYYRLQVTIP